MITLLANIDNNIFEFLPEYNFYLFVFKNDCQEWKLILNADNCSELSPFYILSENNIIIQNEQNINIAYEIKSNNISNNINFFIINTTLSSGIYDLFIYGKNQQNEIVVGSELVKKEKVKIYNPENNCYNFPYITNEFNYILTDSDNTKILYRNE